MADICFGSGEAPHVAEQITDQAAVERLIRDSTPAAFMSKGNLVGLKGNTGNPINAGTLFQTGPAIDPHGLSPACVLPLLRKML